jgi:hypothetical protein
MATSSQSTFDTLPNGDKSIILEARKPRERGPRPAISANLHDISAYDYLEAYNYGLGNRPEQASGAPGPPDHSAKDDIAPGNTSNRQTDSSGDQLLAHMTKRTPLPPGNIQRVLSTTMSKSSRNTRNEITVNGKQYRSVNMAKTIYCTASHQQTRRGALVDGGANGGIAGDDVRVIDQTSRQVDVQGIDNHQIVDIPIASVGAVVKTQRGDVIAIMHQYAYTGKGKTIHSSGQLEWFKQDVNDRSVKVKGGLQRIQTADGYCIPTNIKSGLPYITIRPYTDAEWDTLPQVILTSPNEWVPSVLDHDLDDDDKWFDAISDLPPDGPGTSLFDAYGELHCSHLVVNEHMLQHPSLEDHVIPTHGLLLEVFE